MEHGTPSISPTIDEVRRVKVSPLKKRLKSIMINIKIRVTFRKYCVF